MSKFFKSMIVLLAIVAMAAPAFASDLSIGGQMRVEGFYNDLDSNGDADMHWDQRMRINTVYQVSDEVMVRIRFDYEDQWGDLGQNTIRNAPNTTAVQTDYAYLQIKKEMWTLKAGQTYFGSPNAILVDNLGTGLVLSLNTPVTLRLQFAKYDENDSYIDEGAGDDTNMYSAEVGFSGDGFSVNGIYALLDDASTDDNRSGFGIAGKFNAGAFAIKAELDILDGDDGSGTDYTGTQFYLDVNTSLSESLNVGGYFVYAAGTNDANEDVIYDVTNWDSFAPHFGGFVSKGGVAGMAIAGWGTDELGDSGIITAALYATNQINDDLALKFQAQYATEEEDAAGDYDYISATASTKYKVATNTYFMADVIYEDLSSDSDGDDDAISFWTQLQVNF